jgi:hypothetical protein
MSIRHANLHPLFAELVNAFAPLAQPAPITAQGPLEPESSLALVLTYAGLVETLANTEDRAERIQDLPALPFHALALVLAQHPEALYEPMVDGKPLLLEALEDRDASTVCIEARIGRTFIGLARAYVLPLLLQDVQGCWERNHEADRSENPFPVAS